VLNETRNHQLRNILLIDALVAPETIPSFVVESARLAFAEVLFPSTQVRPSPREALRHVVRRDQAHDAARVAFVREQKIRICLRLFVALRFGAGDQRLHDSIFDLDLVRHRTLALRRALEARA
jgi:hypothetical protein